MPTMADISNTTADRDRSRTDLGLPHPKRKKAAPHIPPVVDTTSIATPTTGRKQNALELVENGAIKQITLTNFKAHSHFKMEFGTHVNFIIGQNGSGKSAILAALIQGLGGNASKHARVSAGRPASGLIQDGKDFAAIEIHIHNGGGDPYVDPSGASPPVVVVQNELVRAGGSAAAHKVTSAFKINGVRVTKKLVRELAEHFNLTVENPCSILTQDVHAKFLRDTKDAPLRYAFFMEAGGLEHQRLRLREARASLEVIEKQLELHVEGAEPLEEERARTALLVEKARRRDTLEREIAATEESLAWAEVERREAAAANATEELADADAELASRREAHAAAEERLAQLKLDAEQEHQARQVLLDELKLSTAALKDARDELKRHQRKERGARDQAQGARDQAGRLDRAIETEEERFRGKQAGLEAARARAAAKIEARRSEAEARLREGQAASQVARAEEEAAAARAAASQKRREAAASRATAKRAEAEAARARAERADREAGGNVLERMDAAMPELVRQVERAQWTGGRPVGPIGAHIKLRPEHRRYAAVVESALGGWGALAAFVVANLADERKLRDIIKSDRRLSALARLTVFKMPFEAAFPVRPPALAEGRLTLLDALVVDNVQASNYLLNRGQPEATLLLGEHYAEAKALFDCRENFVAYTLDGTKHSRRGNLSGSERQRLSAARGLIGTDVAALVEGQRHEAQRLMAEAAEAESNANRVADEARRDERAAKAAADEAKRLAAGVRDASKQANAAAREAASDEASEELAEIRARLDEMRKDRAAVASELAAIAAEEARAGESVERAQAAVRRADEAHQETLSRSDGGGDSSELDSSLQKASGRVSKLRQEVERLSAKKRELERGQADVQGDAHEARKAVEAQFGVQPAAPEADGDGSGGAQHGEGEEAEEGSSGSRRRSSAAARPSFDELHAKLKKLSGQLRRLEKEAGGDNSGATTLAALLQQLREAEQAIEKHDREVTAVRETAKEVKGAVVERVRFFVRKVKEYSRNSALDFNRFLSLRGLAGALEYDLKNETLDVCVQTSSQDPNAHMTHSVRTLSGGEQAFSTLCLIMAMWQLSVTPMRALDEFDKNMDSAYQRDSLRLLFDQFRMQRQRQFLVLTPLDYSSFIKELGISDDECKIHRLQAVQRVA